MSDHVDQEHEHDDDDDDDDDDDEDADDDGDDCYEPIWVRTNAACLWEQCVIKDAQGQPLGCENPDPQPQFAPWKPNWGMRGGAPGRE